jgi:hypothetical protein
VAGIHERNAGRDAALTFVVVAVAVAALVQIKFELGPFGPVGPALVALLMLYAPMRVATWRGEDIEDYGFVLGPLRRELVMVAIAVAVIVPVFAVVYFGFYDVACSSSALAHVVPAGMCSRYLGTGALKPFPLDGEFFQFVVVQLVVVAMTEELFFRGFLLGLLEKRFPPARRVLGGGIGLALVISAAAFAVVHVPRTGDPRQLMTFFPGLLFGWMRSSTKSIVPSTLTHLTCNVLIYVLDHMAQR